MCFSFIKILSFSCILLYMYVSLIWNGFMSRKYKRNFFFIEKTKIQSHLSFNCYSSLRTYSLDDCSIFSKKKRSSFKTCITNEREHFFIHIHVFFVRPHYMYEPFEVACISVSFDLCMYIIHHNHNCRWRKIVKIIVTLNNISLTISLHI